MLVNYLTYLKFLNDRLEKFFEKQKPYICCQKGCGMCCRNAQFPYSQMELSYLLQGLWALDLDTKKLISANIKKLQQDRLNFKGERFLYDCPFLINNVCSVYEYRGIVCRTFGLLYTGIDGRIKVPFCSFQGYNYANVLTDDGSQISSEKFEKLGIQEEPVAFNISYEFLTNPDFERGFNFSFGEKRPVIEWFIKTEDKTDEQITINFQIS